jgi:thiol-disulfide isomerase/thioredoxin
MQKISRLAVAALCAFALFSSQAMADATLKMGDPAPALSVAKFVKGEPVKSFEKGKIYVVEFWATWCGPCRESIPHLTQMQKDYPDVIFIGSNVGETEEKVAPFLKDMGDKMDYRVAIDDLTKEGGANNAAFMEASGQTGIPTAFVIDKETNIAWIGHPMEMEPVLKQVVAGTFDVKKASAAAEAKNKIVTALQSGDFDTALKAIDGQIAANPSETAQLSVLEIQILLKAKKDPAAAAKKADELSATLTDPEAENGIAWTLATADGATPSMLATAQKLSEASLKKQADKPEYLDTLARVYAMNGDFKKAAELETTAVNKSTDAKMKTDLGKSLEAYLAGNLPAAE